MELMEKAIIDLVAAKECPDFQVIVQLNMGLNDLQAAAYLGKVVSDDIAARPYLKQFQNGVVLYLERLTAAHLFELLHKPLSRVGKQKRTGGILWQLIESDQELGCLFAELESYSEKGANGQTFAELKTIRNVFGAHYNHSENGKEISSCLDTLATDFGYECKCTGMIWDEGLLHYRSLFADLVQCGLWRSAIRSSAKSNFDECPVVNDSVEKFAEVRRLAANFTLALTLAYLDHFDLRRAAVSV